MPWRIRLPSLVAWAWVAALAYVVAGALTARIGQFIGAIGSYCADPHDTRSVEIYGACEQCTLYFSVFGAINLSACPDSLMAFALGAGVATPHAVIVMLSLLVHPLPWLLRWALLVTSVVAVAYALWTELQKKRPIAGIHRALLLACVALASAHALML